MGCFFGCFRVKDGDRSQPHLVSATGSSKMRDPLVSDNRLASLLRLEANLSPPKDAEKKYSESIYGEVDTENFYSELKNEANFLKSCGTLSETPSEIRKASEKIRVLRHDQNHEASNFHSWLPASSGKRLLWEEEPDNVPISPVKPADEGKASVHGSLDSPDDKYMSHTHVQQKQAAINSSMSSDSIGLQTAGTAIGIPVHLQEKDSLPSVSPELPLLNAESKKCVRFECDPSESDSGTRDIDGRLVGQQESPYPTPLRLTEEMQTPATVFPAKLENLATGKNARIRSQYVYPVLNPIENSSQWNALKDLDTHQLGFSEDTSDLPENYSSEFRAKTPMSGRATDVLQKNEHGPQPVEASLADWLKPASASDKRSHSSFSSGKTPASRSSDRERPILGMVAAHWNDDEPSQISPKWWDGNGIPNSTNKYKEDQKVSWHATPFEERLEKALSDEKLFPQQNHLGGRPISFEDHEESDTAASHFQAPTHLTHLQSVVQS